MDSTLSPWEAETSTRKFYGNGNETLKWLETNFIPYINNTFKKHKEIILTGYSLCGLFSLWALYESTVFDGAICCSGSLWYHNWEKYVQAKTLLKPCSVYLSLGGKEEKTKNPIMASVGNRTREQLRILKKDPLIKSATLEMNPGGHFADTGNRIAKGINWFLSH